MEKIETNIAGAWLLRPKVFSDERGFFLESWSSDLPRTRGGYRFC